MIEIYPSILAADFANLQSELESIASADGCHIDVMDGHFVPNLSLGLPVVQRLCEVTSLTKDVHLMIENPERWVEKYADAGADSITFHMEATSDPGVLAKAIRDCGSRAALAVKPGTPIENCSSYLGSLDMILVMTVEPGFGGQALLHKTLAKVEWLKQRKRDGDFAGAIQVDGGVNLETIPAVARAGADIVVAGSAVFREIDRARAIAALRSAALTAK